ncbi:MAG: hypothetical protein B7Z37_22355 [Verrucomicrobia bacterium 12-59-8]|nr:MAG: hypothetical protein B7Z37_22355 [Verrucomicrobia bacterium 12-59-8]
MRVLNGGRNRIERLRMRAGGTRDISPWCNHRTHAISHRGKRQRPGGAREAAANRRQPLASLEEAFYLSIERGQFFEGFETHCISDAFL